MSTRDTALRTIQPGPRWPLPKVRDAWSRRELLWFLAVRDVKVRYAQTVLGIAWTIVQPLVLMAVFILAFRKIGRVETGATPYAVFTLAGLTFWTFFARAVTQGADSLVNSAQLVTKTAAPRLLIPASAISSGLVDFGISLGLFFAFAGAYGEFPGWQLMFLPVVLAFGMVATLGPVLLFAALNAHYRDVRLVVPFLVQIWLFLSPVAFPIDALGTPWSHVAALNPLVAILEGFRWSLLGTSAPGGLEIAACLGVTGTVLVAAALYFGRAERLMADRI